MKAEEYIKINNKPYKKYLYSLISRTLLTTILILTILIICNIKKSFKISVDKYVYQTNYNFSKINSIYKKYLLSLKKETSELTDLVSKNKTFDYTDKKPFLNGVLLNVGMDYPVKTMESGIIVFIGKKDDMDSVVMQQSNGIDVIYANVVTNEIKLYDYVEKGTIIGSTNNEELYLSFLKNNEVLNYEPYIEN